VIIQHADGTFDDVMVGLDVHPEQAKHTFSTAIPHRLLGGIEGWIDRLIGFAFDTLDARHVELRVIDPDE
jgi:hypothetical protein